MSTIRFFCVICGTALEGKASAHGDVVECHACARQVPVPGLVKMPGGTVECAPVFPPDVLALEVKFLCTSGRSPLRADARWEGRKVVCPVCKDSTQIPRWSQASRNSQESAGAKRKNISAPPDAARLSPE